MIVEITTAGSVTIDTQHPDFTQSAQAQLALLVLPYKRRVLEAGVHPIAPSRRDVFSGVLRWTVEVIDAEGTLYTYYKPVFPERSLSVLSPTPTILEPGQYYPVGDINLEGQITTDKIVANIEDPTDGSDESEDAEPFEPPARRELVLVG